MWDQYKKPIVGVNAVIGLVTVAVYLFFDQPYRTAATYFLVVQFATVSAAVWTARIRSIMQRPAPGLIKIRRA